MTVTFGDGVTLVRCSAHEQQYWVVDGAPTDSPLALARLRDLFQARRGQGRPRGPVRETVIRLDRGTAASADAVYPTVVLPAGSSTDAQLTALLRARGLEGSWAVA